MFLFEDLKYDFEYIIQKHIAKMKELYGWENGEEVLYERVRFTFDDTTNIATLQIPRPNLGFTRLLYYRLDAQARIHGWIPGEKKYITGGDIDFTILENTFTVPLAM